MNKQNDWTKDNLLDICEIINDEIQQIKEVISKIEFSSNCMYENLKWNKTNIVEQQLPKITSNVEKVTDDISQLTLEYLEIKKLIELEKLKKKNIKFCSIDCDCLEKSSNTWCCRGQKGMPYVKLGDKCYYN